MVLSVIKQESECVVNSLFTLLLCHFPGLLVRRPVPVPVTVGDERCPLIHHYRTTLNRVPERVNAEPSLAQRPRYTNTEEDPLHGPRDSVGDPGRPVRPVTEHDADDKQNGAGDLDQHCADGERADEAGAVRLVDLRRVLENRQKGGAEAAECREAAQGGRAWVDGGVEEENHGYDREDRAGVSLSRNSVSWGEEGGVRREGAGGGG